MNEKLKKLMARWRELVLKPFWPLTRVFDSRNTPCSICGSADCNRKDVGPWHPAPHRRGKPPKGGIE